MGTGWQEPARGIVITILSPATKQRFWDNNGNSLAFGLLTSYAAGTTTPIATYKDSTGISTNTNPIQLNFRGEADIWLQPNVAYKFALTDALGNAIPGWPIDNIISSQLITLYGGVDTGGVNAYSLTFVANFTSYTDGIYLIWIPSHTNTGPSTININGLGVINLTNFDGSALIAGEIVQNQPATILIKGGVALLTSATSTVYGTFPPTWSGFSVNPALTPIPYRKNGTSVTLIFNGGVNGTSNSTSFSVTGLPAIIIPTVAAAQSYPIIGLLDNGVRIASGLAAVSSGGIITFYKDGTLTAWTASGAKGFADFVGLTYSL